MHTFKFIKYFEDTFIGSKTKFPIAIWNLFETDGPRTKNNVEGYHHIFKNTISVDHPDIFPAINKLKSEENQAKFCFRNSTATPFRRKLSVFKNELFNFRRTMLVNEEITLSTYLKYVIESMNFDEKNNKTSEISI